jgi:predicted hydrocarbon binding protein
MNHHDTILAKLNLSGFFADTRLVYDLEEGTVRNPGSECIYVSADIIRGVHRALVEKTADAWKIIFRNCGRSWGKRVAGHLDAGLRKTGVAGQASLPLTGHLACIEAYFAEHGRGLLKLDLSPADRGLVVARLKNSYFAAVLSDVENLVDPLLAGILQGFVEHVSGTEPGCSEIACVRKGAPECVFVITAPSRLDRIEAQFGVVPAEEILANLASIRQ